MELAHVLGPYQDAIVLVGGLVPGILLPQAKRKHVGSLDVDLALNHLLIIEDGYRTIHQILTKHGYVPDARQPFIFRRTVQSPAGPVEVQLDLLAAEYHGTGRSHRSQRVQDLKPRKARGCDLALESFVSIELHGLLPGGAADTVCVNVASLHSFIVMKAMAMRDRLNEKDAYDVYFCLQNADISLLLDGFRNVATNSLVAEAMQVLEQKFETADHIGPFHVADFLELRSNTERRILQEEASSRVLEFVHAVRQLLPDQESEG